MAGNQPVQMNFFGVPPPVVIKTHVGGINVSMGGTPPRPTTQQSTTTTRIEGVTICVVGRRQ